MNRILYENRCKCNEDFSVTKKRKGTPRSEGKPLQYPKSSEITSKTFQMKCKKPLSLQAKLLLNNFQNKYSYYAMDDILYSFNLDPSEKKSLLAILYSPIISLQNNFSVNFFDIWIRDVYIEEIPVPNAFLKYESQNLKQLTYITVKFFYKTKLPVKKNESLW